MAGPGRPGTLDLEFRLAWKKELAWHSGGKKKKLRFTFWTGKVNGEIYL